MDASYKRTSVYSDAVKSEPKFMFVWLCNKLDAMGISPSRILDVGTAAGDFLDYASKRYPVAQCEGVEYDSELVSLGRQRHPDLLIHHGDANQMSFLPDDSFDAVFLTGVHSIFDDFRPSLSECVRVAKAGGTVLVLGIFNPYPLDARIHWRYPDHDETAWHPGYNLFSKQSVGQFMDQLQRVERYTFEPFTLPFDLQPQEDPVRSWTEQRLDGERTLRNGIMPLNFELLTIYVKQQEQGAHE